MYKWNYRPSRIKLDQEMVGGTVQYVEFLTFITGYISQKQPQKISISSIGLNAEQPLKYVITYFCRILIISSRFSFCSLKQEFILYSKKS